MTFLELTASLEQGKISLPRGRNRQLTGDKKPELTGRRKWQLTQGKEEAFYTGEGIGRLPREKTR